MWTQTLGWAERFEGIAGGREVVLGLLLREGLWEVCLVPLPWRGHL